MADLKPGNYGEYKQVNGSSLWINWSWDISLNEVREREPGPGLFYGQIREKHKLEEAHDCVIKCYQFTEQAEESVKAERKRVDAHIALLEDARHAPTEGDSLDNDLSSYVVFSYFTETFDIIDAGGFQQSYILQPQELCCTTLQDFLLGRHEGLCKDFGKNYAVRRQLLENIALGLKFVHKHGRCHRKLEPTSIMLKRTGCDLPIAKLSDFTLVKEDKACYSGTTRTLNPGSIGYMAPELRHRTDKEGNYEKSMDMFSLGIVAYQIMATKDIDVDCLPHPFHHGPTQEDMFKLQQAINDGSIPSNWLKDLDPQDAEAKNLIECLLQRDPAMRPNIDEVLKHPFFWTPKNRMLELRDMSKIIRDKPLNELMDDLFPLENVLNRQKWDDCLPQSIKKSVGDSGDASKTSSLASVVRNTKSHFTENGVVPDLQEFLKEQLQTQSNIADELLPSLDDESYNATLALYFKAKFPKLTLLFKTVIEFSERGNSAKPLHTMSACCRIFYRQHAEPGAAQGCRQCKDRQDHFCDKNYDGAGVILPIDLAGVPDFSRYAILFNRKEYMDALAGGLNKLHNDLRDEFKATEGQLEAEANFTKELACVKEEANTMLQLWQVFEKEHQLYMLESEQLNKALDIGKRLGYITRSMDQALRSGASAQLEKLVKGVEMLKRKLCKVKRSQAPTYTIADSLAGQKDGKQVYIMAKRWVQLPLSSRYYLLIPFPRPRPEQFWPAQSPAGPLAGSSRTPAPSICPGGCRCSRVLESLLFGKDRLCPKLHDPTFVPPSCELCHSSTRHICTVTYYGGYMPVDVRGDGGRLVAFFDHGSDSDSKGTYMNYDCDQREFIFAVNVAEKKGDLVPLNWSPNHADCPFSAYCPYPISCLFNHGRLQDVQSCLTPLKEQCSKCNDCLRFMQGLAKHLGSVCPVQQGNKLNHICSCRNYNQWKALEAAGSKAGEVQELRLTCTTQGGFKLYTISGQKDLKFVAAVQHATHSDYGDYYAVVPLQVFSTKSEEEVCPLGCHCPEGVYCQKSHLPHGTLIGDASMAVGSASDVTSGVSSSSYKQAWKVSPSTQAKTPSSTPWIQPMGPSNSRAVVSARQPSDISQAPSFTQEAGRAAPSKMTLSTNKGKKKNKPEDKITLADLRGK